MFLKKETLEVILLVLLWPEISPPNLFFSENLKFRKAKCVYTLFLSKSKVLKILNHRITEICKIVITKFLIFSSG